jgi:hypothetical protein
MTRRFKSLYNKPFYIAKAFALAIFPLVLLLLPTGFFDNGPEICLFTRLSGYHCPGCGMTRGCMHLIHLDIQKAWDYNKVSFIVLPILCGLLIAEFRNTILKIRSFNKSTDTDNTEA